WLAWMGRSAGSRDRLAIAVRQRADVRAPAADVSGIAGPPRCKVPIAPDADAGRSAARDHADRSRDRARLRVRPALSRFSVRRADHGGGAVFGPDPAQSPAAGRPPERRGAVS